MGELNAILEYITMPNNVLHISFLVVKLAGKAVTSRKVHRSLYASVLTREWSGKSKTSATALARSSGI